MNAWDVVANRAHAKGAGIARASAGVMPTDTVITLHRKVGVSLMAKSHAD